MTRVRVPDQVRPGTFGWCLVRSGAATMANATSRIRTEAT